MYKRILVITGSQPWIDASVEYAIALAASTGADLSLLTVPLPPVVAGMPDGTACSAIALESVVAQSETVLAGITAAAEQAGVSYTTRVRWGNTAAMILHTAAEEDCDLIIVGSYAPTWRSRQRLSHIIKKVTASARQPLLVVTAPPKESYNSIAWSRLLVVHDGSPSGEASVHYGLALAQEASLDVCLLHVNALRQHDAVDSFSGTQHGQDILTLAASQTAIAGTNHDVVLASGNIVTDIVETAAAKACGVIVLGVAPYSGWQRLVYRHTVKAVLASTALPLLLLNRSVTYWH
jgi:nucleotide-binding universal stress UspA family protein